jgi:EAL domain-containing protein (putative c-di-GMP-specific phosphodiesterase class I)
MDVKEDMSLSLLMAALEIVPEPLWFKDTKCRYMFCNAAYEAFCGMSCHDIVGKTDYDLFPRDVADVIVKHDMQAMLSSTPIAIERPFYGKDGASWTSTIVTKFAVKDECGKLIGILSMHRSTASPNGQNTVEISRDPAPAEKGHPDAAIIAPVAVSRTDRHYTLEDDIRRGIKAGEFTTFFQPKINLTRNDVIGAEALIRWKHPKRGHIPPSMFLPMAEATGLIVPITDLVLGEACQMVSAWNAATGVHHTVSVNLSYTPLVDPAFLETVTEMLTRNDCCADVLDFEITEALINTHAGVIDDPLMQLHKSGIGIVIDDFGSGYLGFTHLSHLPIKTLKIDRVFVKNIEDTPKGSALLRAMVAMAHELGMEAIAEGVETLVDRNRVKDAGCDVAQGYYWCKPLPRADFMAWTQDFVSIMAPRNP